MTLRARLLASFVGIALFVLLIFGTVAYRIAVEAGLSKEVWWAQRGVDERAQGMATPGKIAPTHVPTAAPEPALPDPDTIILTRDMAGGLPSQPPAGLKPAAYERLQHALLAGGRSGQYSVDGRAFVWAAAAFAAGTQQLILVRQVRDEVASPLATLGIKLAVAGVIMVWVAVWGALILATVIARRLDSQNAKLLHQALHDDLTGLPNRNLFYDRLHQAIVLARRAHKPVALVAIDLDRFKEINDALGHQSGDLLLREVSRRLCATLRASDTVARVGGDEFALLLPDSDAPSAVQCVQKLLKVLRPPLTIDGVDVDVETSIGVAVFPDHGDDADALIRHANVAMYHAKQHSTGIAVYQAETDPHSLRRLTLLGDLRSAIEHNGLALHYQPKVNMRSGAIVGVEALLRWQHPSRGPIPPGEFIVVAEQSGLIKTLTEWVLKQALHQCHAWRRAGIDINIGVNLSARNLHDAQLPTRIRQLLEDLAIPAYRLQLEITESAMMADPVQANRILSEFDAMGVGLAIDDFGTGYSSLAYLKRLPVNEIKIDKSFILDMETSEDDASIVRTTIDLAHNLGLKVVAEGIEGEATWTALQRLGCDIAQGYYICKPIAATELTRWLEQRPHDPEFSMPAPHTGRFTRSLRPAG